MLILHFETNKKTLSLVCLYGPNRDTPIFYTDIKQVHINLGNPVILVGDFNLVLDPDKDHYNFYNYLHTNNTQARAEVLNIMAELDL